MEQKAVIGDKGDFVFADGFRVFGDILHIPQATGECWVVDSYDMGKKDGVIYIQNFEYMRLTKV